MKIEKKIWLSLIASVLFAVIFSIWIFRQDTVRNELPFDNTTSLKTTSFKTDGAKTESVILSDEFTRKKRFFSRLLIPMQKSGLMGNLFINTETKNTHPNS